MLKNSIRNHRNRSLIYFTFKKKQKELEKTSCDEIKNKTNQNNINIENSIDKPKI